MAKYDPQKHHRKSIRLRDYDYAQDGAYFVTICTHLRQCLFGDVSPDGVMQLNDYGRIVKEEWLRTPILRPSVDIDTFAVMPNHFHGIVIIHANEQSFDRGASGRGTMHRAPYTST